MKGNRYLSAAGVIVFSIGVILSMAFITVAVWGDLEAALFDPSFSADKALSSLSCPVLITSGEEGFVTASVHNPIDRPMDRYIRVHISHGYVTMMREIRERFTVMPGDTRQLEWSVTSEDAAFGRLILLKANLAGRYPLPAQISSCGILVLNIQGVTGNLLINSVLIGSVLSLGLGTLLWRLGGQEPRRGKVSVTRSLIILGIALMFGVIFAFMGWWVLGLAFLVIILLMIIGFIVNYLIF